MTTKKNVEQPQVKKAKTDSMFTLVKKDEKVKIAIGNYQVSKKEFDTFNQADQYLATKPYEILINVTCLFAQKHLEEQFKKQETK